MEKPRFNKRRVTRVVLGESKVDRMLSRPMLPLGSVAIEELLGRGLSRGAVGFCDMRRRVFRPCVRKIVLIRRFTDG